MTEKVKRLYYLADVFTLSRFGFAIGLIICAVTYQSSLVALILFVIGELFDAADGGVARYATRLLLETESEEPDRSFWIAMDKITDIWLGMAVLVYIWACIDSIFAWPVVFIGIPAAATVEILSAWDKSRNNGELSEKMAYVIILRRLIYVIILALEIMVLIIFSPCLLVVRYILFGVEIAVCISLFFVKYTERIQKTY